MVELPSEAKIPDWNRRLPFRNPNTEPRAGPLALGQLAFLNSHVEPATQRQEDLLFQKHYLLAMEGCARDL